jgi:hypothetical protein
MKRFIYTSLLLGATAFAQQPAAPPAAAVQPDLEVVTPTPAEAQALADAWKDLKIAQLQLQVTVSNVKTGHPDWSDVNYDYVRQQFLRVKSATLTPAPVKGTAASKPATKAQH